MTQHAIAYVSGKWQCYSTDDGIGRRNEGPRWDTPREAAAYVERMEGLQTVSPLRDPVTRSGPNERTSAGVDVAGSSARSGSSDPVPVLAGPLTGTEPSPVGPEASPGLWPD